MVLNTFQTAQTRDEQAEGYGEAAGSLAGTMAGAAAGAAIGSVVPIIGTAVGGLVGAYLGSMGGQQLGGWAGLSLFGSDKPKEPAAPITPMLLAQRPGPAVPSLATMAKSFAGQQAPVLSQEDPLMRPISPALGDVTRSLAAPVASKPANLVIQAPPAPKPDPARVDQKFSYSLSMPVTVEGDAKDPQQFVQQLMPLMQRALSDAAQQEARRNLYDDAHT